MRDWYYSIGIELEVFISADYPAIAEETIHDVLHSVLDPLDNNRHIRVTCNLVANVTDWRIEPVLCSLGRLDSRSRIIWPPFRETTVLANPAKTGVKR